MRIFMREFYEQNAIPTSPSVTGTSQHPVKSPLKPGGKRVSRSAPQTGVAGEVLRCHLIPGSVTNSCGQSHAREVSTTRSPARYRVPLTTGDRDTHPGSFQPLPVALSPGPAASQNSSSSAILILVTFSDKLVKCDLLYKSINQKQTYITKCSAIIRIKIQTSIFERRKRSHLGKKQVNNTKTPVSSS